MGLFGKKRKQSAEAQTALVNIDFECLSKAHVPPVTVSENPEAMQICPTCENPMFPEVLAKAILTGVFEERDLNQTELGNCAVTLFFLFWAQHNVMAKPLVIQGVASSEVILSSAIPKEAAHQEDLLKVLDALESFGSQELGDASDLKVNFVIGRNFLQWVLADNKQVAIEPLPHFAVINSKNYESINKLLLQVSKQFGWATWHRYMDFFTKALAAQFQDLRPIEVIEVILDFQVVAATQDAGLIAEEPKNAEIDLLHVNVLPILASNRAPTNLIGPVSLEIETQLDAFQIADSYDDDGEEQENFELEFNTSIKFLILAGHELGDTESELRVFLQNNFNLAIYFDTSSQTLSWGYLTDTKSPVAHLDSLDLQIISFGSDAIKVKVRRLNTDETSNNLEGTPWHM